MRKDDNKKKFLEATDKVYKNGEEIKRHAHRLLKYGQNTMDLADASRKAAELLDPPWDSFWENGAKSWNRLAAEQESFLNKNASSGFSPITVSSSSASLCVVDLANLDFAEQWAVTGAGDNAKVAAEQLSMVLDRFADKNTLISLIKSYGLNWAHTGAKTPVDLIETAIAAYEKPTSGQISANTSLLPMRECCNSIVTVLINRRPRSEKASSQSAKIKSIGAQLGRDSNPCGAFDALSAQWVELWTDLSNSKKANYTRFEWQMFLKKAILFLLELLQSIEPNKMNSSGHINRQRSDRGSS